MRAADNAKVADFIADLTTGGQTASIRYDYNTGNNERIVIAQTTPDGKLHCQVIKEDGTELRSATTGLAAPA